MAVFLLQSSKRFEFEGQITVFGLQMKHPARVEIVFNGNYNCKEVSFIPKVSKTGFDIHGDWSKSDVPRAIQGAKKILQEIDGGSRKV